jgi:NADPH:quinone reductase-like Zn-dependent oxidoreductase
VRAVVFTGVGGNEVISVVERPDPEPAGEDVLVAVRYAGVNPADLAQREGRYPAPTGAPADVPGIEVAGTVVATGPGVTRIRQGERVFGLVDGGGLADRVLAHERHLVRVPETVGELEAAALPETSITAHDALVTQGRLGPEELLLVNGANGGVGTAAVQIGSALGARVLASVRNPALRPAVAELGAEVIDPAEVVAAARERGGVDVVLELVGAPNLPSDLVALASLGRIVVVGTGGGWEAPVDLRRLMTRRAQIVGTVLRARALGEKAAAVEGFEHDVVPHLASGRMRALVDTVIPAAEATRAFERLASPGKLGKVLLDFG